MEKWLNVRFQIACALNFLTFFSVLILNASLFRVDDGKTHLLYANAFICTMQTHSNTRWNWKWHTKNKKKSVHYAQAQPHRLIEGKHRLFILYIKRSSKLCLTKESERKCNILLIMTVCCSRREIEKHWTFDVIYWNIWFPFLFHSQISLFFLLFSRCICMFLID